MASKPPIEKIQQLTEVLGVTESQAVLLLKKHNNNAEQALNAYFEDPGGALQDDPVARQWEYQDNSPPFRIDVDNTSTGALPAMSRPPSRADQNLLDLTDEHAQAAASVNKTNNQDEEDAELQRAIDLSLNPEMSGQENGVTGTGQQFGPARRSNYEPSQWSMMPVASSREIVDHPPPAKRRRMEGQPAFLRGSKDTGYLGPLLTIFHAIPLAREALLLPSLNVLQYGYAPDWWSGNSDENRKSLSLEIGEATDKQRLNLLAEIQCLTAFLDDTKRAYGSVDALADLYSLRTFQSETPFSRFLEAWRAAAIGECPHEQLTQIFSSTAMKGFDEESAPMSKDMVCLEPQVNRIEGQLLVDLIDVTVWNDTVDTLDDVWISQTAEVFTIHMYDPGRKEEGLHLTTSAVWFPDRYMEHCREVTRQMRQEMQLIQKEISTYIALQNKCQFMWMPRGDRLPIREVLEAAAKSSSNAWENTTDSETPATNAESVQFEIEAILARIDKKLDTLEGHKIQLRNQMHKIAHQLTQPSTEPDRPPYHKYTLQGVSTKPEITYVRCRNPDLLGLEDGDDIAREEWQWWRIEWKNNTMSTSVHPPMIGPMTQSQMEAVKADDKNTWTDGGHPSPYLINKVTEEQVIEAAKLEHNAVVLIYANEHAMNFAGTPVSQALRQFVDKDNLMFERECREEVRTAGWGSEDTFENVPLDDDSGDRFVDREMTPMSISSPHRDEDGQPSPKRPKSSDANWNEQPPAYDEIHAQPEMQERPGNKIGMHAERFLEKFGQGETEDQRRPEGVHIEHPRDLPR